MAGIVHPGKLFLVVCTFVIIHAVVYACVRRL